jgi:hypothetical protein
MAKRNAASRPRSPEDHAHFPRAVYESSFARDHRWSKMVGWLFPRGATKSHTHTSPACGTSQDA